MAFSSSWWEPDALTTTLNPYECLIFKSAHCWLGSFYSSSTYTSAQLNFLAMSILGPLFDANESLHSLSTAAQGKAPLDPPQLPEFENRSLVECDHHGGHKKQLRKATHLPKRDVRNGRASLPDMHSIGQSHHRLAVKQDKRLRLLKAIGPGRHSATYGG